MSNGRLMPSHSPLPSLPLPPLVYHSLIGQISSLVIEFKINTSVWDDMMLTESDLPSPAKLRTRIYTTVKKMECEVMITYKTTSGILDNFFSKLVSINRTIPLLTN